MLYNTGSSKCARASIYFRISSFSGLCPWRCSHFSSDFSQNWNTIHFDKKKN